MKFVLEIELGNDAMENGADVGEALRRVAESVYLPVGCIVTPTIAPVKIRDINGNTVGKWEVREG